MAAPSSSSSSSNKPRSSSPFRFFQSPSASSRSLSAAPSPSPSPLSLCSSPSSSASCSQALSHSHLGHDQLGGRPHSVKSSAKARSASPASRFCRSSSSATSLAAVPQAADHSRMESAKSKECVAVTIRFRPLSALENERGDEIAWYPDGDTIVRCEYNQQTAYAYDTVFGPATTTKAVYDVAAEHVIRGAMDGVDGIVFAYGVTSSGKTHTMHGDQKSPGIISLAVKDVFNTIQNTPGREFLLRVSYIEIYNEVINDLLNPSGTNLRLREDTQGTYVEGIKEEVILSPAHALSLIAVGEGHRHVGSNNFNVFSSRSHTIFTLTIESSSTSASDDDVALSHLSLIDLAGSESSKTDTTGLRRKEGSYINKSLLTLGTVIGKLSDGKPSHVPFRDSKLTRLLQWPLSGHGRVSLICTITPASSYFEETHNTLKFAHRAKRIEIHATSNRVVDEKSLIKRYQKQISALKEELDRIKRGRIVEKCHHFGADGPADILNLRQQLEAGQVKLQSRLQEEEQAKEVLLGRIQRLTKLILVSTKNSITSSVEAQLGHRRRHSFGGGESIGKVETKSLSRATSMQLGPVVNTLSELIITSGQQRQSVAEKRHQSSLSDNLTMTVALSKSSQPGELPIVCKQCHRRPPVEDTMADQVDLLREQIKMLAGEVAFCTSSLKRMLEKAATNPGNDILQARIQEVKEEIQDKKRQMCILEKRILGTGETMLHIATPSEMAQAIATLTSQVNELTFELEIRTADNRVLQEQLQAKIAENYQLQGLMNSWRDGGAASKMERDIRIYTQRRALEVLKDEGNNRWPRSNGLLGEQVQGDHNYLPHPLLKAVEMEKLKEENIKMVEEKGALQIYAQKLAEEASYAKSLATAAAVELKKLAEEVTSLSFQNAKLRKDLALAEAHMRYVMHSSTTEYHRHVLSKTDEEAGLADKENMEAELHRKLGEAKQKEAELESDLAGMWKLAAKLKKVRESFDEQHETEKIDVLKYGAEDVLVAEKDLKEYAYKIQVTDPESQNSIKELKSGLDVERRKNKAMELFISQLKSEELEGLNVAVLDGLQNLHVEALTKLCQAKAKVQHRLEREKEHEALTSMGVLDDEMNEHICKVCYEEPTAAVLLPCRHFCLCKPCAAACKECPLCRSAITDRIIAFTA